MNIIFHSPLGFIEIECIDNKIVSINFLNSHPNEIRTSKNPLLNNSKKQILEYLQGQRTEFDLPYQNTYFDSNQLYLLKQLEAVKYGETIFYETIIDNSKSRISTKSINISTNSMNLPIIIPSHRIISNMNGLNSTYIYWRKKYLLAMEAGLLTNMGLHKDKVQLVNNSPIWKKLFRIEKEAILSLKCVPKEQIHHIGSTAIDFIKAKPIIDILIGVKPGEEMSVISQLETVGYVYKANFEPKEWHYLTKGFDNCITHHLHLCHANSDFYKTHILFKDLLNNDIVLAKKYESIKMGLSEQFQNERQNYTQSKEDFIRSVLKK